MPLIDDAVVVPRHLVELDRQKIAAVVGKLHPLLTDREALCTPAEALVATATVRDARRLASQLRAIKQLEPLNRPVLRIVDQCVEDLRAMLSGL